MQNVIFVLGHLGQDFETDVVHYVLGNYFLLTRFGILNKRVEIACSV